MKNTNKLLEIWKDIAGYEGKYQVSNFGRIKSLSRLCFNGKVYFLKKEKILKKCFNADGYVMANLYGFNGRKSFCRVHRLVAMAFIPNPENKLEVNHINGIKDDNRVENLEWNTRKENQIHSVKSKLLIYKKGSEVYNSKLNEDYVYFIKRYFRRFPKTKQALFSERTKLCRKTLNKILKGKIWKHVVV